MNLGVQYYRPPFPENKYWEEDFKRIRDCGLNTVQLWVIWGWVESKPGEFVFDDYDRLVQLADENGLGVVLSTIAEVQPYWIHREVPGSEMIDHMGNRVISSNRGECHFGITPGGCTDHPVVWERMSRFLQQVVKQYRNAPNLHGWDAWNELRWNVQADGYVCYCENTLEAFRQWLMEQFGSLDELNRVWKRRYGQLDEIMPGKFPDRPYTEMMSFEHFLTHRCDLHAANRYNVMKPLDPDRPITVHAGTPAPTMVGSTVNQAVNRGNDWFFADVVDGVGTSSFPKWHNEDDAAFGMRIECVYSAAQGKKVWLSELQGGRAAIGMETHFPVDALSQQRWIWNGFACGADTILFWCWRDEVFGRESAGFGLSGDDGLAQERLEAMKITGDLLEQHSGLLENYQPVQPEVGVMFSPQSYYYYWAQENSAHRAAQALAGYTRSLVKKSIPYLLVEEQHLAPLEHIKILFLPRCVVTTEALEERLIKFVKDGGTLVCESECGSFNPQGLYRYPADRFTAKATGLREIGRRRIDDEPIVLKRDGRELKIFGTQWMTPWKGDAGTVSAEDDEGALITEVPLGKGKMVLCATYLGDPYLRNENLHFENFIEELVLESGWRREIEIEKKQDGFLYIKSGESQGKKVVYVFVPRDLEQVRLKFEKGYFKTGKIRDIISGKTVELRQSGTGSVCTVKPERWKLSVLVEQI